MVLAKQVDQESDVFLDEGFLGSTGERESAEFDDCFQNRSLSVIVVGRYLISEAS